MVVKLLGTVRGLGRYWGELRGWEGYGVQLGGREGTAYS